jgi:hypothetical protein
MDFYGDKDKSHTYINHQCTYTATSLRCAVIATPLNTINLERAESHSIELKIWVYLQILACPRALPYLKLSSVGSPVGAGDNNTGSVFVILAEPASKASLPALLVPLPYSTIDMKANYQFVNH